MFLVIKKSNESGSLLVPVNVYTKVIKSVDIYAFQKIFASYCVKSAVPLGMFSVIVSSSYESIA